MYVTPKNDPTDNHFELLIFHTSLFYHFTGILTKTIWF